MRKKLFVFVPIFLAFLLLFVTVTPVITMSENISQKIFRLHILANSDDEADQNLKLKVRDRILEESENIFTNCKSVAEAIRESNKNIKNFESTAKQVINEHGYKYDVKAYVTKEYFNTREYDNFTLPAGIYDSLKIEIGEAKGHNWWCVMFPSVCLSGCTDDLNNELTKDEFGMVTSGGYKVRFKIVEFYEKIKSKF